MSTNIDNINLTRWEHDGVFVKLECNDAVTLRMFYNGADGEEVCTECTAAESGEFLYLKNDIRNVAKERREPVPFRITVEKADGTIAASGKFTFAAENAAVYLTVTRDGRILEGTGPAVCPDQP